jgi:hypothetical protein
MDHIFDIPIQSGSLIAISLNCFKDKKYLDINNDFIKLISSNKSYKDGDTPERNNFVNKMKDYAFISEFKLNGEQSLNQNIHNSFYEFEKSEISPRLKDKIEGFNKYGKQWIRELKNEYIRIYNFVSFNPLDIYQKIDSLKEENKDMNKELNILSSEVEKLKKENEKLRSSNNELESLYYNLMDEIYELKEHASSLSDRLQEIETPVKQPPLILV